MNTSLGALEITRPEEAGFRTAELEARFGPVPDRLPGSLESLPPAWRRFVYLLERAGLIGEITRGRTPPGQPPLASFSVAPRLTTYDTDGHIPDRAFARGVALREPDALSKALGEFLERYALAIFRESDFVVGSPARLTRRGLRFLDPRRVAGFSEDQRRWFPERGFDDLSCLRWVEGRSLTTKQSVLLLAQLVFWNDCGTCGELDEPFLRERNTNGAAGGFSRDQALTAALYELVERDAFLLRWLHDCPPPRIEVRGVADPDLAALIGMARRHDIEPVFLDTTSDLGIPSCVCVTLSDRPGEPRLVCGGAANLDPVAALRRSLTESLGVRAWAKKYAPVCSLPPDYVPFRTRGIDQAARVGLWSSPRGPKSQPLLGGPRELLAAFLRGGRSFPSPGETLAFLAAALRARGPNYEVFFYEAPHPLLRLAGYHVVRAIVPALLPLYMNEENAPLGASRLHEAATMIGGSPAALNPLPHPFP